MTRSQHATVADLASLVEHARIFGDAAREVTGVAYDSRAVRPGAMFFCAPGARSDGHDFAPAAVASGAAALVAERRLDLGVPCVVVPSVRAAMAVMAAGFFGDPSASMRLVGVTGTNGKTTTSFMLERCFQSMGMTTGLMGTVEAHIGDRVLPVGRTTPEAIDVQRTLAEMRDHGVAAAVMEVSSHGLALRRVDGIRFACAVFTNLTQDHLDFHETMEDYFLAKSRLFDPSMSSAGAINAGDPYGRRLVRSASLPVTTFSVSGQEADVRAVNVRMDASGSTFDCEFGGGRAEVRVRLAGPFNIANALAALAAVRALGLDVAEAAAGIEALAGVPGRFERVDGGREFTVLVDYAHTPDSVERVLRAARSICAGELIVVVGCGGDRDRSKRPLMGRAAATLADRAILTSDNPRSEVPRAIIAEMEQGARETGRPYEVEEDRLAAIRSAIAGARAGDVVVIAGKGHESGQEFEGGRTIPFDDRAVARRELERLSR